MEPLLLLAFAAILITCVLSGHSMFIALFAGWVMFFGYGLHKGKSVKQMLLYCKNGIAVVRTVLITFMLIGMLTAVWRPAELLPILCMKLPPCAPLRV